jgi:hypothetical protein
MGSRAAATDLLSELFTYCLKMFDEWTLCRRSAAEKYCLRVTQGSQRQ